MIAGIGSTLTMSNALSTLTLTGNNTYTGATAVNAGTLQIGDGASMAASIFPSGQVQVAAAGILAINLPASSTFANDVNNSGAINVISAGSVTVSGVISGSGAFNQAGAGTTTLTGGNIYSGQTVVSNGLLQIGTAATAASLGSGAVAIGKGATLVLVNVNGGSFGNNVGNGLGGVGLLNVASANNLTFSGVLSDGMAGQLALMQSGAATTTLTSANTYSGTTTIINGGTLVAGVVGALPATVADGGTAAARSAISMDQTGAGSSTLELGANQVTASLSGASSSQVTLNGSMLTIGNSAAGVTTTFAGVISDGSGVFGSGGFTKDGTSTQILTGINTYTGLTTIRGGVLQVGTVGAAATIGSGAVAIGNGGSLSLINLNGNVLANDVSNSEGGAGTLAVTSAISITASGALTDGGVGQLAVTFSGAGTMLLTNSGNSYSGGTTIGVNSTVILSGAGTIGNGSVTNNGMLGFSQSGAASFGNAISGGGGLTQNGPGTVTLTGANTYTGGTSIAANSTVILSGAGTVGNGPVANDGTLSFSQSSAATFANVISGAGALVQSGPGAVTLTGANTYSGTTTIGGGALQIGNSGTAGSIGAGAVGISNGGALTLINMKGSSFANNVSNGVGGLGLLNVDSAKNITLSGGLTDGLSGQLALTQSGNGTTILTSANTYTGATSVVAGNLMVNGSLAAGSSVTVSAAGALSGTGTIAGSVEIQSGSLNPGGASTPGTFTLGILVLDPGSTSHFRLGQSGVAGGALNDLVSVTGNLTLGGILNVTPLPGFGIGAYTLFDATSIQPGTFASITGLPGYTTAISTMGNSVELVVNLGAGQYWDGANTTGGGVISGGSGSWNTTASNWTSATGASNSNWQNGTAIFAASSGTVTLTSAISAEALIFGSTRIRALRVEHADADGIWSGGAGNQRDECRRCSDDRSEDRGQLRPGRERRRNPYPDECGEQLYRWHDDPQWCRANRHECDRRLARRRWGTDWQRWCVECRQDEPHHIDEQYLQQLGRCGHIECRLREHPHPVRTVNRREYGSTRTYAKRRQNHHADQFRQYLQRSDHRE